MRRKSMVRQNDDDVDDDDGKMPMFYSDTTENGKIF